MIVSPALNILVAQKVFVHLKYTQIAHYNLIINKGMKENKEEKEWQFLGYSQIKHTLSPGDFVSVNINEKGLLVIDATEVEGDTPQTPEWEEEFDKTFVREDGLMDKYYDDKFMSEAIKSFIAKQLSQAEEIGRKEERERIFKQLNTALNKHSKPTTEGGLDYIKAFKEVEKIETDLLNLIK